MGSSPGGAATEPVGSSPAEAGNRSRSRLRPRRHNLVFLAVAALVVAVDQLTKWWALEVLKDQDIHLIWTLRLHLVHNSGAAFGLGQSLDTVIGLVALGFVVIVIWAGWGGRRLPFSPVLLGMVLGGAVGNLSDRAVRAGDGFLGGAVVDFIDLQWWPVFNAADSAIVVAAIALVLSASGNRRGSPAGEPHPQSDEHRVGNDE
ncbi:signal peptidase II [Candidatus Poriferisocius sp.]|uniref:signal peptidase II n=1 Tax=Candidatus Poriferisocius sp. TaxID=3101276 RepID=UPI003B014D5B